MMRIQPVILSGGSGTRLWPLSRAMYPKQLLALTGGHTMLQETVLRTRGLDNLSGESIVVCNEAHRFLVAQQLSEIEKPAQLILEPVGRNTAPAGALAALAATAGKTPADEPTLLLIMPADHVIPGTDAFVRAIGQGIAPASDGRIVCFGIVPTHTATGYGYIESETTGTSPGKIRSFVEKPDEATARDFVAAGRYYWNAGIFLIRADVYLDELGKREPEMLDACKKSMIRAKRDLDFLRPDAEAFGQCPSNSIDYAIMEATTLGDVVPLDAGWSDLGSWAALYDVCEKDSDKNSLSGDVLAIDCSGSFISAKNRLVAAVGVDNLVVIEDKDAVLIAPRAKSQDVKKLVTELERQSRAETRLHRQVYRPWGSYDSLENDSGFQVKHLIISPGGVISLQKHAHRAEHWVVVRGKAHVTLNDDVVTLVANESICIPVGAIHRIENREKTPLHIIEVQCGEYLGEDDIVRLEDNYGRV